MSDALKAMGLPDDFRLPGLSDASNMVLENYAQAILDTISAEISIKGIPFQVIQFTPSGKPKPLLIIGAKKFDLSKSIPGLSGTPLGAMGELKNVAFIYAPKESAGKILDTASSGSDSGSSVPKVVEDVLGQANLGMDLLPGMNLTASVSTSNLSNELKELMKSVGVAPGKTITIGGKISPNIFKKFLAKDTDADSTGVAPPSGLAGSAQMKTTILALLSDYGKDFLSDLDISGDLPKSLKAGPLEIKNGKFFLKGGKDGSSISFGVAAESAIVSQLEVDDLHITYDADKKEVSASGEVGKDSLSKLMNFKGLKLDKIALASTFSKNAWSFNLIASADLNGKTLISEISILKVESGTTQFQVMLDGGPSGISAKDVAGRDVPGLDKVALTKVVVTNDRLVADLLFGARKTPGEIAAFHPAGFDKAVLAVTVDKVELADLVPGKAGSELEGVSVQGLTLVVVPQKSGGLKPDGPAIPEEIAANLKKVLTDAATHDPKMHEFTLHEGINLLADLDIKGSKGLGSLMASGGLTETVIPVVGTLSLSTFDKAASKADRLKGLSLLVGLPDLKVPGLPNTITITHPIFAITETAPDALKQPEGAPPATGPFITIGADLVMQAAGKTHEFDALLMVGKDEQGKAVIDLMGSAKDPKGLFKFKGLTVKTLELASMYEAGNWDF
ncbi:MAG: hypothetical protein IIA62_11335, partial [Nitrospinae bacterium]|nr:hypothetical protein [Nitrospinota bacterium]